MSLTLPSAEIVDGSSSPLVASHESWPRARLGSVATILNGAAFKSKLFSPDGGIPLIRIRDIASDRTSMTYAGDYDERYLIQRGQLLVGMDGDFNVARWSGELALLNQRVCRISPLPELLDLKYLTCLLPGYLQAIHEVTSSTTVKHLSSRDIADIPIPLPSLSEQRRIAERLDGIAIRQAAAKAHLGAARDVLERFRSAVLAAACSGRLTQNWRDEHPNLTIGSVIEMARERRRQELGTRRLNEPRLNSHTHAQHLPASWGLVPLGLLLREIKYGTSKRSAYETPGTPILRIPNVSAGVLDVEDLKFAELDESERASLTLRAGDLLMIRSNGSVQLVGLAVPVTSAGTGMAYAGYLLRLRTDGEFLDPSFLRLALASPELRAQIELPARSTSGVHNINMQEVRGLGIALPPLGEQREIVRRADAMLATADRLAAQIDRTSATLDRVSKTSLAKAFRGELVPTEAALAEQEGRDFESAEELLIRIDAEEASRIERGELASRHVR